jgi:geranylgeranyl diphosphate synthase type II
VDVDAYIAERVPLIDRALHARFDVLAPAPAALVGAMRHLLFPGGKRLRPVFALAAAEAVGGPAEAAVPLGVALELIHTYSLVHDDLPCMDDDDERRGQPTVHVAYDEATAVLAGDALLSEAFAVMAEGVRSEAEAGLRLRVVARVAEAAGALGLVGGQVDDLSFEAETDLDGATRHDRADWLASIHARKTAALFRAAIVGGASLGGADAAREATLDAFALDVGIGFQIADDLLDADSGEAASILRLHGIEDARDGAEALLERALERVEGWGEAAEPLRALARFAIRRRR